MLRMGCKYKVKKADLKALFGSAEMHMSGKYHTYYERLGLRKGGPKGNFFCFNAEAHGGGTDLKPSLSIDESTGKWTCFACGIKGNFQKYWRDYIKGGPSGDSYTDFLIDFLELNETSYLNFSKEYDKNAERNSKDLRNLYEILQSEKMKKLGRPWILSGELTAMAKEMTMLPMEDLNKWVDNLLKDKKAKDYLYQNRRITEDIIKRHKLGWFEHVTKDKYGKEYRRWKYVFPMINAEGDFVNAKAYDPTASNPTFKWVFPYKHRDKTPVPINNFTKHKILFLEGEPDLYCALSFGYEGAVTFGSISAKNVDTVFGRNHAKQLFKGKEIVICFDSDEASQKPAQELAMSLFPYVKQIKIVDLNKSEINPNGLDPELTHEVKYWDSKAKKEVSKIKRSEKDFTDFMKKNGFDDSAKTEFDKLIQETPVFTYNTERKRKEVFKVTLQEARTSKYFSADRSKELELVASVVDFNCSAFMYPTEFTVSCRAMGNEEKMDGKCKNCSLPEKHGFGTNKEMVIKFMREIPKESINDNHCIEISDHNILGLVQVTDNQKMQHLKKLCSIHDTCRWCMIVDGKPEKLLHVTLSKDVGGYNDLDQDGSKFASNADIDMDAYIRGDSDIYPNKPYKFMASQTTAWNGQHAVLFIDKCEPMETSIEAFEMDQDVHDLLSIFTPNEGESISDHLKRRYKIFADAAGITGRQELFFMNDLAFFSTIELDNKMLPEVKRGWVEVLIAGDPRTGKTLISKFLHKHYKIGEIVAGSSGVSRSGLIGGVSPTKQKGHISWGKIPMNDGGLVIIDEMSEIDIPVLFDMTNVRSEGVADISKIVSSTTVARCRKIMLSNARQWRQEDEKKYNYGIQFLKELCLSDKVLARFDVAFVVKGTDVAIEKFKSDYSEITTEFNEYQCRHLIMWAYSRKSDEIEFEDGFNEYVNKKNVELNNKYHQTVQLVNQERVKLVRLSISVATMLYSTVEDDWNKIYVKKEHLDYVVEFLNEIYCHQNMRMDHYTAMIRSHEVLGNMRFMENISEYVDLGQLLKEEEFTERAITQIFYDYLSLVSNNKLYMPDACNDTSMKYGGFINDLGQKFIGVITARNCFSRTGRGMYKKTSMFNTWLGERITLGDKASKSNILELKASESADKNLEEVKKLSRNRSNAKKGRKGRLGKLEEL